MKYLLVLTLLSCSLSSFSQMISGKVISERGFRAANINVNFKNKANTVLTNPDGTFKIMASSLPDTLVFSADGYEPYNVVVTDKTVKDPNFEIVLLNKREAYKYDKTSTEMRDMAYSTTTLSESVVTGSGIRRSVPPAKGSRSSYTRAGDVISERYADRSSAALASSASYSAGGSYSSARPLHFIDSIPPIKDISRRSQLLSAGEVNDFKKWKMWEDYNKDAFKQYSDSWNMSPLHRYSIQLQNQDRVAIIGQQVYLINKTNGDTTWTAVTDNTGKAELWSNFSGNVIGNYYISVDKQKINSPREFGNGMNTVRLSKPCNVSKKVDIAFVVDATGSMQDEIEYLKLELEDVIRNTFEKNKDLDLNVGSVFYRDVSDAYLTRHINFQSDLLKVLNFIKLQSADGGGDYPEAVNAALHTAIDSLSWSDDARSKILFVILDAPPHHEAVADMIKLAKQAAAKGIRIVPIACSGTDKSTEFVMRSIALATNGTYLFLTDDSGVGGSHIKPTTDAFDVELLNTLLSRTIQQMIYAPSCTAEAREEPVKIIPNVEKIKVYPNPTQGNATIEVSGDIRDMFVTDFTGKILMRISTSGKEKRYSIDLSSYPSATYIIRYITKDNRWGSEKLVVVH